MSGQRQRVATGRALVRDPKLFLFDEPLSNLGAKLRVEMRAEIKRIHKTTHASIAYVTYDQIKAMTQALRIFVLKGGVVQQIGTPQEIYGISANTFVADLTDSPPMNLVPARVTEVGLDINGTMLAMGPGGRAADLSARVTLGIRSEHLSRATGTPNLVSRRRRSRTPAPRPTSISCSAAKPSPRGCRVAFQRTRPIMSISRWLARGCACSTSRPAPDRAGAGVQCSRCQLIPARRSPRPSASASCAVSAAASGRTNAMASIIASSRAASEP